MRFRAAQAPDDRVEMLLPIPVNQVGSAKAGHQAGAILEFDRGIFVLQTQLIDLLPGLLRQVHISVGRA